MKFFTTTQIRQLDQYTIEHEPISSINLMERAANALYGSFTGIFPNSTPVCILAGQGNNGGDALALARLLLKSNYQVSVYLIYSGSLSADCETNRQRLRSAYPSTIKELKEEFDVPIIPKDTVLVDGLFGSGLSRPLGGIFEQAVAWMNQSKHRIVSIDIPSGLSGEENKLTDKSVIVKASITLSLQFPKLAFLLAENAPFVGKLKILDIGIHPDAIDKTTSNLYYLEEKDITPFLKSRSEFSHKGTFGHALIVAGSKGMAGASVLSSLAALRSGAGLVTVHGPAANRIIVQTSIPEVIFRSDTSDEIISHIDSHDMFSAIAIGPGIGTLPVTAGMLHEFLVKTNNPCVIDADALNIISMQKDLLQHIPKNSILTPHPKEFERLFGECNSSYERIMKAQKASKIYGIIIVLKGAHTVIAIPNGNLYFNSTGNSGMSTAGSGDVLTGILAGLLAQGYSPEETALTGVYLHGHAGDLALRHETKESLIAGDIISSLGDSFRSIRGNTD
ncbi:MAG: NAD(P)H-hydrate dehydratase [Paludibacter sp.]|nr:NAD(P)H-hydrate dehydratase [Paludibacter sp.]